MMIEVAGGVIIAAFICGLFARGFVAFQNDEKIIGVALMVLAAIAAIWIVIAGIGLLLAGR